MDQRISLIYYHQVLSLRYVDRRLAGVALIALAIEAWVLLSDFHLFWKPPRVPEGAVRVAKVLSVSRQAKARSSLQLNWFDLTPGQDLYEGDEVATMDRSGTTLKFVDGQSVTLEPNSFLVLRSGGLAGEHDFQISLVRGGLQQDGGTAPGAKSRLEIEVGGRKVVAQGQASLKIEQGIGGQPEIAVDGGDVSVTEIGLHGIEIGRPGGPLAANAPGPYQMAEVKAPQLQSPVSNTVLTNPEHVRLHWKSADSSDAPTLVEVSRDEGFHDIIWHVILSVETSADYVPDKKGRYFWRATRLGDRHAASTVASFEVRRELNAPILVRPRIERGQSEKIQPVDAPVLGRPVIRYRKESWIRPVRQPQRSWLSSLALRALWAIDGLVSNDARASDGDPDQTRFVVDLQWGGVPQATAYVLQLSTDEDFHHIIAEKVLTQSSFSWHTDTAGFYYWRVAGVDKDGDRGPFSEFNTFSIKAERNRQGDESSYETYLRFDDYSKYTQNIRGAFGPITNRYYYSGNDVPYSVIYKSHSYVNGQLNYDYRLSPYYSLQFALRVAKSEIGGSDYQSRPDQPTLNQYETQPSIGIERRFFYPRHYWSLETGVRATFVDMPIYDYNADDGRLAFSNFGFFGPYGSIAYHRLFGEVYDGALLIGAAYQSSGDSQRATQYASIEARRQITEYFHVGLRVEEIVAAYQFNSTDVTGSAHSLSFQPAIFVDWSF